MHNGGSDGIAIGTLFGLEEKMKVTKRLFGNLADGTEVHCWTISEKNGIQAEVLDYGATLHKLVVPDKNGNPVDVVLGYDQLEEYLNNRGYLGATIGRFGNRIGKAEFELNGKKYQLAANNGENHLHGGNKGFDKVVWNAEEVEDGVRFSRLSPDGEEGYPGNLKVSVTMSVKNHGLELKYYAVSDQDTIVNLTNHSYFNLNGMGDVQEQTLQILADQFTINDDGCLPTGELVDVEGTAMDFRTAKAIGKDADLDEPCVKLFGGYDVNFVLKGVNPAMTAHSEKSGITMKVVTDQPGVQLYTANQMAPRVGKYGIHYGHRSAFCLETQHFPDCIHHPEWPSCVLKAGDVFESTTTYAFEI